ncbi:MAG: response regulator transcription factor [Anaerolineae bacterium]|nr:response regulator transcription factor [Gemmatimonadaceae bacterium]
MPLDASADGSRPSILVIDDELKIRGVVRDAIAEDAARCLVAGSGREGLEIAAAERPDLIVLDLGLPDMDGIVVCRKLREWTSAPIVVLSARHSEEEKAALLDAGADDYVTKPFAPIEFRARIRAQLRRARMAPVPAGDQPLIIGELSIDAARRTVSRGGAAIHLTPTEWGLLNALVTNSGRTMTHQQLFRSVWGSSYGDAQQYLRVYIVHLRRKIEADPYAPRHIVTEPGVGYRFEPQG